MAIMENILSIFELIGAWLIFISPLYQGMLELQEQVQNVKSKSDQKSNFPKVSAWYWLIPPLKIQLEKKRMFKVLNNRQVSAAELKVFLKFLDKATAWFYVALGGLLTAITFWLLIIIGSIASDNYRINNYRQNRIINKIKKNIQNNS